MADNQVDWMQLVVDAMGPRPKADEAADEIMKQSDIASGDQSDSTNKDVEV